METSLQAVVSGGAVPDLQHAPEGAAANGREKRVVLEHRPPRNMCWEQNLRADLGDRAANSVLASAMVLNLLQRARGLF